MESEANSFRVEFPDFSCSILQKLNEQRQVGQLCDITVVIQGRRFRAHKAVLAASSPYFCDQVLLKNSMQVVLPDIMQPSIFESLLQSCYTGTLVLPVGEIVGFLTAASFLQMWHVVDKCTELLGESSSVFCQRSGLSSDHTSPGNSSYHSLSDALDFDSASGYRQFSRGSDCKEGEVEQVPEGSFSPQEQETSLCASPPWEPDHTSTEGTSQDGEDRGGEMVDCQFSRPIYIPPSIMYHKRWIQVKAEKLEKDDSGRDCGGSADTMVKELEERVPEQVSLSEEEFQLAACTNTEEKLELDEGQEGGQSCDEPVDFYGASMEEFSSNRPESDPILSKEDSEAARGEDTADTAVGVQEETSHSGFAAVIYKLYPCQCGKSFTHKSQRDRHMGMHLGLRPYGCTICGKKFKMKHHLVGHMKIHTGIKPYECSICRKRFMWRDSFHRHVSSCTKAHQAKRAAMEQSAQIC
ncbi:zinc finger and BTB domain-containing protein 43-like [Scleropages formosus]|uniref:Zinc finger and BTB domain containing 43 n=1 Tax=Scleropages formosus TaxID=113540 RepID=A0A8C9RZN4_SCLFO|nr:zinc finger and BTB domain-containing protein 43-like [Scleropages formosus]